MEPRDLGLKLVRIVWRLHRLSEELMHSHSAYYADLHITANCFPAATLSSQVTARCTFHYMCSAARAINHCRMRLSPEMIRRLQ